MRMCQCGEESAVIDSREVDGSIIRRRRECPKCKNRWTTYEVPADAFKTLQQLSKVSQVMATARRLLKRCEERMGAQ